MKDYRQGTIRVLMAVKLLIFVGLLILTMTISPENWTPARYVWAGILVLAGLMYAVKGKFSPRRGTHHNQI